MTEQNSDALSEPEERVLVIERLFDAPRELVFACWIEPEHVARWMGPKGFTSSSLANDPRPGGHYRVHMVDPDGGEHWLQGVFREITPPERLVRTFCWADANGNPIRPETLLTVTFADVNGHTRLTLHQEVFESVAARDDHQRGWSGSFDRLAEYLATI